MNTSSPVVQPSCDPARVQRPIGTIRNWRDDHGYGWIDVDGGESVFLHHSNAPRWKMRDGERVWFSVAPGLAGKVKAVAVQLVDGEDVGTAPIDVEPGTRITGTVSHWFDDRGYGFIAADNGRRYFLHCSDGPDTIAEGARVVFELGRDRDDRIKAINVHVEDGHR